MITDRYDWPAIRLRYLRGESAYAISKALGGHPAKQAIAKRAKKEGWERVTDTDFQVAEQLPITARDGNPVRGSRLGLRSRENIAVILHCAALGLPNRVIAGAVGIDVETLRRWQIEDPQLAAEMRVRRCQKAAEWIGHIDAAATKDWKAADRLLQVSPETRDQFGTRKASGNQVQVVLNIDRDGDTAVIEGVAACASADG